MFYSDYGHAYWLAAIPLIYHLMFFADHFDVYADHRLVQSAGYGDVVWC